METHPNQVCPKCGEPYFNIYYEDDSDLKVAAWCENCDMKGFYAEDKFVPLNA